MNAAKGTQRWYLLTTPVAGQRWVRAVNQAAAIRMYRELNALHRSTEVTMLQISATEPENRT